MHNLIKPLLSIGIKDETPNNENLGKFFFNLDGLLAIISTFIFALYYFLNDAPPLYTIVISLVCLTYCLALYCNNLGYYKTAIFFSVFYSYIAIAISTFIAPYFWIPFYLIQLGISFFIYMAHEQKKAFFLFFIFTASAIILFLVSQIFVHDQYYLKNTLNDVFPVVLFLALFIYKITVLIFVYQKIISTSKRKEIALKASENKYRIQFENTQLGVVVIDEKFKVLDTNTPFCKMMGYSKEEIMHKNIIDYCYKKTPEAFELFSRLIASEISRFEINRTFLKKNGEQLITNAFITGIYDEQNKFICANCSFLDITQKVNTEIVLEKNRSRYQDIFENMNDSIIFLDPKGNITESNAAAKKLFETEDLNTLNIIDIGHPDDFEEAKKNFKKLLNEGFYNGFQVRIVLPENKIKYLEVDSIAIKDEDENFIGSRDILKDITDRKLVEIALRENEGRYRTIFENAFEGLIIFDTTQKKWTECNSKILDIFSTTQEDFFQNFSDFFPEVQKNNELTTTFFKNKLKEIKEKKSVFYECTIQNKEGDLLDIEATSFNMPAPNQNLVVSILKDITEKNKQEAIIQDTVKQLNQKNEDLQKYIESNMQLENFAYIASHDLKAPLRTITSYVQLIHRRSKDKFDETELEFLEFIIGATKNMGRLIDALLTYSKVDSQEKSFKLFDAKTFIYSIAQELKTDIEENNITIEVGKMPNIIFADPARLRQLFQNLISNSIKFKSTLEPPIIKINCIESELEYQFSIEDNGIGIKEEFFEKIFSLFTKLHTSSEYEGTGIGLALCKKVVEQHHGKIWISSIFGKGTTFYFTICKNLAEQQASNKSISITSLMN